LRIARVLIVERVLRAGVPCEQHEAARSHVEPVNGIDVSPERNFEPRLERIPAVRLGDAEPRVLVDAEHVRVEINGARARAKRRELFPERRPGAPFWR